MLRANFAKGNTGPKGDLFSVNGGLRRRRKDRSIEESEIDALPRDRAVSDLGQRSLTCFFPSCQVIYPATIWQRLPRAKPSANCYLSLALSSGSQLANPLAHFLTDRLNAQLFGD
jgi:hypothetical protein